MDDKPKTSPNRQLRLSPMALTEWEKLQSQNRVSASWFRDYIDVGILMGRQGINFDLVSSLSANGALSSLGTLFAALRAKDVDSVITACRAMYKCVNGEDGGFNSLLALAETVKVDASASSSASSSVSVGTLPSPVRKAEPAASVAETMPTLSQSRQEPAMVKPDLSDKPSGLQKGQMLRPANGSGMMTFGD